MTVEEAFTLFKNRLELTPTLQTAVRGTVGRGTVGTKVRFYRKLGASMTAALEVTGQI